jgi:hypothetical protein
MRLRLSGGQQFFSALVSLLVMLFVLGVILRAAARLVPGAAGPIRSVTSRADLGNV